MTEINWEALGVLLTISLAFLAGVGWLIKLFWGWRKTVMLTHQKKIMKDVIKEELEPFVERIKVIEVDMKSAASKNVEMSQAFHSEINKILYLFTERE